MKLSETAKLLTIIAGVFDYFTVTEIKAQIWHKIIGHHDYRVAEAALANWLSTSRKGPPDPGSINDEIYKLAQKPEDKLPWGDAWALVVSAIPRYGYYQADTAISKLPPQVARAIGFEIGFKELCLATVDSITTHRAQFRQRYESGIEDTKVKALQLPILNPDLQKLIETTSKELVKQ